MRKKLRINLAIATLCLAALVSKAPSAKAYDMCNLTDPWRGMECAWDTMEQCRASASGRGGTCGWNPLMNTSAANAYAFAPRGFNAKESKGIKR